MNPGAGGAGAPATPAKEGRPITARDLRALFPGGEFPKPVKTHSELKEGDFVLVFEATPRLGHVEKIRIAGSTLQYVVRVLIQGRRWAAQTTGFLAEQVWPLPSNGVGELLTRKGHEPPPAVSTSAQRSTTIAGGAAIPLLPGVRAAIPLIAPDPEITRPPMPPGELTDVFAMAAYPGALRRYQAMAMDAFEKSRAEGRRRAYLVLPPGCGVRKRRRTQVRS